MITLVGLVTSAVSVSGLDLATLQATLDAAPAGQVIVVPAGEYWGQLVINQPVVLKGQPGARIVHEDGEGEPTLWVNAPGTTVEGLELRGSGQGTRRDHTALVVTASRVVLRDITITRAWAGLWIDGADQVSVEGLRFVGLDDYPFWERGEGVRVSDAQGTRLNRLDLAFTADGLLVEKGRDTQVTDIASREARYGVHLMFGSGGTVERARVQTAVVGLMVMETSDWRVAGSEFTAGSKTGSAGIRAVRTSGLVVTGSLVSHQASGVELLDTRQARFTGNRLEENAVAWAWGGDNTGTLVVGNRHRGNLLDVAGAEVPAISASAGAHDHTTRGPSPVAASDKRTGPAFEGNAWDAWKGFDLDGDGFGDTPYRFDRAAAVRAAARPWAGLFLGSPWSLLSQGLPGGEVLDPLPLIDYH